VSPRRSRHTQPVGTGLLSVFGHHGAESKPSEEPAAASGDSPGEADSPEQVVNLSIPTYPQLFLDNPTRSVPRGVVAPDPSLFLPIEANGRIGPIRFDGEVGYNFGNKPVPACCREFRDRRCEKVGRLARVPQQKPLRARISRIRGCRFGGHWTYRVQGGECVEKTYSWERTLSSSP
jgi:hypothetical protein